MSKSTLRTFVCPKCEKEYEIITWDSINATLDPELKERLYHNEIFKYECPHCHQQYSVFYPCLYHNVEKKFMVWLLDEKTEKDLDTNTKIIEELKGKYKLRKVKTILDFLEKVRIFEEDCDDRLVEIAKMVCENQAIEAKKVEANKILNTMYNFRDNDIIEIVTITDNENIKMHINIEELTEAYKPIMEIYKLNENEFSTINREWMLEKMTREQENKKRS